jgi:hypothetical protein
MIEVVKFKAEHLEQLNEQQATAYLLAHVKPEHTAVMENSAYSFTGISEHGRVVVCAGVVELYQGRGEAWAILDANCKREFLSIHNAVKRFLEVSPVRRVEAVVDEEFAPGHRWVQMLGFELEAPRMRAYRPGGENCALYARVRC